MTMTWRRFALPLVCLTGVCCMATLSIANGGIWDKHFRSRPSATPHRVPTPAELEIFFIDATADSPASFEARGNEVAIENSTVDPVSMSEDGSVEPVSEETAVVETSEDAVASEECNNPNCDVHGHTWWCSTSKFWRHTLHMKARRKTNNQSFYRNVPAYNVENYGFYRTCWRRLQDCDCCPEDVVHNENTLPAEAEPTEK